MIHSEQWCDIIKPKKPRPEPRVWRDIACAVCTATIHTSDSRKKYCSIECNDEAQRRKNGKTLRGVR